MITIKERLERARSALEDYRSNHPDYRDTDEPDGQALIDLVADLLHLAKGLTLPAERVTSIALMHFEAEE